METWKICNLKWKVSSCNKAKPICNRSLKAMMKNQALLEKAYVLEQVVFFKPFKAWVHLKPMHFITFFNGGTPQQLTVRTPSHRHPRKPIMGLASLSASSRAWMLEVVERRSCMHVYVCF